MSEQEDLNEIILGTAYHEAAHAVIGYLLNRHIVEIFIDPEGGEPLGMVVFSPNFQEVLRLFEDGKMSKEEIENEIIVILAGQVFENPFRLDMRDFLNSFKPLQSPDWRQAIVCASLLGYKGDEEINEFLLQMYEKAADLYDDNYEAIEELAITLLSEHKLTGEQASQLIKWALGEDYE